MYYKHVAALEAMPARFHSLDMLRRDEYKYHDENDSRAHVRGYVLFCVTREIIPGSAEHAMLLV